MRRCGNRFKGLASARRRQRADKIREEIWRAEEAKKVERWRENIRREKAR